MNALLLKIKNTARGKQRVLIAIDGPCGSGKTTLARKLNELLPNSAVVHTDDFFLRPFQRTPERMKEPGFNMDRERLMDEVLDKVGSADEITYFAYDCQTGLMRPIKLGTAKILIVEGSYSLHPDLWPYYDLAVYLSVDNQEQVKRIERRVGKERLERFVNEWIPLENRYFSAFDIKEKADVILRAEDLVE